MAPHAGFDTEQVRDKARKDLLYLLEGVSARARECASGLSPLSIGDGRLDAAVLG